jgi:hypothetical protein
MKETAVEWLEKIRQGQKGQPFDDYEWEIAFNHAKEIEKEQMEEIREMLVQGALTNMSCASAVVEFDRLTKQQEQ